MKTKDFDYHLPEELIAQRPIEPRDESRLMVLFKGEDLILHRKFKEIVDFLREGDVLVLNDTRVIPARLFGYREGTGANIEVLLLHEVKDGLWESLVKPGRRAKPGTRIIFGNDELVGQVVDVTETGERRIRFFPQTQGETLNQVIERIGNIPLPPYIKAPLQDRERYQTVYSKEFGAVAAPTAGLHFTPSLLEKIKSMKIDMATVTLHVGLGTFRPVQVDDIKEHKIHSEYCSVPTRTAEIINEAKGQGRRIIAVGTTVVRALEASAQVNERVEPCNMWTDLFITPGYEWKVVDGIITNFHLPKSTLLMLVSAFYGREALIAAYENAIRNKYRFYSFGDAMAIFLK